MAGDGKGCPPFSIKHFVDKTAEELMAQVSYRFTRNQGVLGALVGGTRGPPLVPDAFYEQVLLHRRFTNGADQSVVQELYRRTAEALLGSTPTLEFRSLEWGAVEFTQLCSALQRTNALKKLVLSQMTMLDDEVAREIVRVAPHTLKELELSGCTLLNVPPKLVRVLSLQTLTLDGCSLLTVLPELFSLSSLKTLSLTACISLKVLPALKTLSSLETLRLSYCTSLSTLPDLSELQLLQSLLLDGCSQLKVLPNLMALSSLRTIKLGGCISLTALPDLSGLSSLETLWLRGCNSLTEGVVEVAKQQKGHGSVGSQVTD